MDKIMNKPQNFDLIQNTHFTTIGGTEMYVQVSTMGEGTVFVFHSNNNGKESKNCLLFDIKWERNTFSIKKCLNGLGTHGNWIVILQEFSANFALTPKHFINFLQMETEKVIDHLFN